MHLMKLDPRAPKDNPDRTRQTKSTPQADALLLATIVPSALCSSHRFPRDRRRQRLHRQRWLSTHPAGDRGGSR